jgi:DNA helicase-2/ATP-dependent DNA helicase PcrA
MSPNKVLETIAQCLNSAIIEYGTDKYDDDIKKVIEEYEYRLRRYNAMDFESLLMYTVELFTEHPDIAEEYHNLYKYVFIDEHQDTNDLQWQMITLINPENLFVVGDDFQAIYGFRGANIDIIMGLASNPEWQVIKLEQNYRSTIPIIRCANNLIRYNHQTEKVLRTDVPGEEPEIEIYDTDNKEALQTVIRIAGKEGIEYSDMAVLARTNRQLETAGEVLAKYNIPYTVVGSKNDVFKKDEIKRALSYFKLFLNPFDDYSFNRVVNFPVRRLTVLELDELKLHAIQQGTCMLETLHHLKKDVSETLVYHNMDIYLNDVDAPAAFMELIKRLNLREVYKEQGRINRINDLDLALDGIFKWVGTQLELGEKTTIKHFLDFLTMKDIQEKLTEKENTVKLLTVHGAKGLEFDTVFVIGMNQDLFPSRKGDIEEERRLFYVAITRAKRSLYITRATQSEGFRRGYTYTTQPSQFLNEIK